MQLRNGTISSPIPPRPGGSLTVSRTAFTKKKIKEEEKEDIEDDIWSPHAVILPKQNVQKKRKDRNWWYPKNKKHAAISKLARKGIFKDRVLRKVPNEIWMQVFDNLTYLGLKAAAATCKSFKAIVDRKSFDRVLFRTPAVPMQHIHETWANPILGAMCYFEPLKSPIFHDAQGRTPFDDLETTFDHYRPAKNERLTFPAATVLQISYGSYKPLIFSNDAGVTVHQMLQLIWIAMRNDLGMADLPTSYIYKLCMWWSTSKIALSDGRGESVIAKVQISVWEVGQGIPAELSIQLPRWWGWRPPFISKQKILMPEKGIERDLRK